MLEAKVCEKGDSLAESKLERRKTLAAMDICTMPHGFLMCLYYAFAEVPYIHFRTRDLASRPR